MTYRKIREWPNEELKIKSANIDILKDREAINDLLDTFKVVGGYGLSAPQIGLHVRAIVINPSALKKDDSLNNEELMLNPVIIDRKGTQVFSEACFSLPNLSLDIERSSEVLVEWKNIDGELKRQWFSDYSSACVQHEIDHLDGVLTIDRISQLRRSMIIKKIKKKNLEVIKASKRPSDERSRQKSLRTRKKNRIKRKANKR
ncbi:MAG: hypothetical protein CMB77_03880 [Euryarchaeota archaeon]|nr:hypothetical protein [Euryarchaeota archaeon]|tara:strand:- start:53267 stop:53872 length:606 start_codon:yes stop_codon:yes gene_type:complete